MQAGSVESLGKAERTAFRAVDRLAPGIEKIAARREAMYIHRELNEALHTYWFRGR